MQEEKTVDKELKDFLDNKFSQVGEGFSKVGRWRGNHQVWMTPCSAVTNEPTYQIIDQGIAKISFPKVKVSEPL
jgi:hypothetical protein